MSDAYRTSAYECPQCRAQLRVFQQRLVCDECNGMMIAADDFVESIRELDGSEDKLEIEERKPSATQCPRCRGPMATCALRLGTLKLRGSYLTCDRDGIWITREAMTAAFARASKRGGFRGLGTVGVAGGGGTAAPPSGQGVSFVGNMPSSHGGMSSAMASIAGAFSSGTPASRGLAISNWQSRRPRVHTLFVSAHKDRQLPCPVCKHPPLAYLGDRWACSTCSGSFVENDALEAMIVDMTHGPWQQPPVSGPPGERACPICSEAMIVEQLEEVTIDRCAGHGVWFDDTELESALHHAGSEPTGVIGWLKRLFRRP